MTESNTKIRSFQRKPTKSMTKTTIRKRAKRTNENSSGNSLLKVLKDNTENNNPNPA